MKSTDRYIEIQEKTTQNSHTALSLLSLSRVPSLKSKVLNFLLLFTNLVALATERRKRDHQGHERRKRKEKKKQEKWRKG